MIDFAHCHRMPDGVRLTHRAPWAKGNHEEGYLYGLDELLQMFGELAHDLERSAARDEAPQS